MWKIWIYIEPIICVNKITPLQNKTRNIASQVGFFMIIIIKHCIQCKLSWHDYRESKDHNGGHVSPWRWRSRSYFYLKASLKIIRLDSRKKTDNLFLVSVCDIKKKGDCCLPEIQYGVTIFTTLQAGRIDLLSQSVTNNFPSVFLFHFVPPPFKKGVSVSFMNTDHRSHCSIHPRCCQENWGGEKNVWTFGW